MMERVYDEERGGVGTIYVGVEGRTAMNKKKSGGVGNSIGVGGAIVMKKTILYHTLTYTVYSGQSPYTPTSLSFLPCLSV